MSGPRQKFATQVETNLLAAVRGLAQLEGRLVQSLIEEALQDLIEKRQQLRPRARVMAAYRTSHEPYGELYSKLGR